MSVKNRSRGASSYKSKLVSLRELVDTLSEGSSKVGERRGEVEEKINGVFRQVVALVDRTRSTLELIKQEGISVDSSDQPLLADSSSYKPINNIADAMDCLELYIDLSQQVISNQYDQFRTLASLISHQSQDLDSASIVANLHLLEDRTSANEWQNSYKEELKRISSQEESHSEISGSEVALHSNISPMSLPMTGLPSAKGKKRTSAYVN